jgi:hypothetical protein
MKSAYFEEIELFLRTGTYPEHKTENEKRCLRRAAKTFVVDGEYEFEVYFFKFQRASLYTCFIRQQ